MATKQGYIEIGDNVLNGCAGLVFAFTILGALFATYQVVKEGMPMQHLVSQNRVVYQQTPSISNSR